MNKKTKALLSSTLAIAMSASLAIGGTYALFTSEDSVNIAVTSGTVDVTATIKEVSLYSMGKPMTNAFENGGTATLDATNENLTLTNITPGDKAVIAIDFQNNSNVAIQYRMSATLVGDLAEYLTLSKVENDTETEITARYTAWTPLAANTQPADMTFAIELPEGIGNEAQIEDQTATKVSIAIEAVQGNADTTANAATAEDLADALAVGGAIRLTENIELSSEPIEIPEGTTATIDLNGKKFAATYNKSVGAVLKNNGTLTITGGTISSTGDNGGSAIQNNGTLTVTDATLNGAPKADESGWPSYAVNNTGIMTLNNVNLTSYHGGVASYGATAVLTLNNCTLDMTGIAGFTSHGIYTYNGGKVVINGGTYINKATDQNAMGSSVINGYVEINGGYFEGRIENYYGTPVIKGGTFTVKPTNFLADGYVATENNGVWTVTAKAE